MATFLYEDSKELADKLIELPSNLIDKARETYATIGTEYPTAKGSKRIKKIVKKAEGEDYNKKKGEDVVHTDDGKVFMKGSAIKKADHEMRHTPEDKNNIDFMANGGFDFKRFYHDALSSIRNSVKKPQIVKQVNSVKPKGMVNPVNVPKPSNPTVDENKKTIKVLHWLRS